MITVKIDPIRKAVEDTGKSRDTVAALAESTRKTLDKMLDDPQDMNLSSIQKIADSLGFDTEVRFIKRAVQPAPATV